MDREQTKDNIVMAIEDIPGQRTVIHSDCLPTTAEEAQERRERLADVCAKILQHIV